MHVSLAKPSNLKPDPSAHRKHAATATSAARRAIQAPLRGRTAPQTAGYTRAYGPHTLPVCTSRAHPVLATRESGQPPPGARSRCIRGRAGRAGCPRASRHLSRAPGASGRAASEGSSAAQRDGQKPGARARLSRLRAGRGLTGPSRSAAADAARVTPKPSRTREPESLSLAEPESQRAREPKSPRARERRAREPGSLRMVSCGMMIIVTHL